MPSLICFTSCLALLVHVADQPLDSNFATCTIVLSPLHRVPAPTFWLASEGISVRIFAMKLTSVRGVKSLRRGSCCRIPSEI